MRGDATLIAPHLIVGERERERKVLFGLNRQRIVKGTKLPTQTENVEWMIIGYYHPFPRIINTRRVRSWSFWIP